MALRLVRNDRLIKRESVIGGVLLGVTFAVLGLGIFLSREMEQQLGVDNVWLSLVASYGIVIVGMLLLFFGNSRLRRFGAQYRQDQRLHTILKGLDDRYVLFAFLRRDLPDYLLLGPGGLFVMTTRPQRGEITCRDDRWSRRSNPLARVLEGLYGTGIGNPSYEAGQSVRKTAQLLASRLPVEAVPPVSGLIVFTGDNVKLRVERCSFPVTTTRDLRKAVTRVKTRLSPVQLAQTRQVLESLVS